MKWAVLSDIHGNREAFEAVLDCLSREGIDKVACLGDIVGYGANPNECIDLVRDRADIIVAGNHDQAAVRLTDIDCFNTMARTAIEWTRNELSGVNSLFLSRLPVTSVEDDLTFVHATPYNPGNWDYLLSRNDARRNFTSYQNRICFIGHSHTPGIFAKEKEGKVYASSDLTVRPEKGTRYIINVGSVGQPRDGIPEAAFGILDTKELAFTIKRVSYDIATAQKKITVAGLPRRLATRIAVGR